MFKILNLKKHQHCIIGSRVTAILLTWWTLPIGGIASGRFCAYSLCSQSWAPTADISFYLDKNVLLTSFRLFGLKFFVQPKTLKTKILHKSIDSIRNY